MNVVQRIACGHTNCYLVTEKENSVLINTAQTNMEKNHIKFAKKNRYD